MIAFRARRRAARSWKNMPMIAFQARRRAERSWKNMPMIALRARRRAGGEVLEEHADAEEDEDADVAEDAGVVEGAKRKRSSEGPPPQGPRRRAGMRSGRAAGSSDLAGRGCSRWQDCLEP